MLNLGGNSGRRRTFWTSIVFLALPFLAAAQDPKVLICGSSCDPPPIINLTPGTIEDLQPTGGGQVDYTFINQTGTIIDNFAFDTTINSGLSQTLVQDAFTCGDLLSFFMNCTVTYNASNGNLLYSYFGVNPPETGLAGYLDSFTNEVGEQEGIPPCTLGYLVCELAEGGRGIFTIELDGWVKGASFDNVQLYNNVPGGIPTFTNSFNAPEPSAILMFLAESLLFAGLVTLLRRRFGWLRRPAPIVKA